MLIAAGAFAYRVMLGGYVFPALPLIVIAGTEPNNIVRNNSDTRRSNSSKTSVTRAGWSEKLQPINIREAPKTVPRVISTIPISSTLSTGPVAPGPAATAPALDPPVASALDQHIAPSVPPLASDPVPVPASSKLNETAAVAPVAREPGAPSLAVAPPVSAASVPPPASAVPVPASSEPHETAAVAPAAPIPALAPSVSAAPVSPPASAPLPGPASSEPSETAVGAPAAPIPALAPSVSAAPVSPPASAPLPGPASSEPSETAVGAPAPTPALAPPVLTAASVPPPASAPLPGPASSELNETAAVAPVAREPGAPSPALVPPLLPVASIPPPVSALSEPKEIHRVIVGLDGWAETDTSSPPALADAQGDAALSPSSRSLMQARSGTAVEVSSGGAYAVQVASERSAAEAHASFRTLRAKFPNQLGGREPMVRRTDLGAKGIYYRAMVGPFASMEKAAGMCRTLKTAGCNCLVQRNWEAR